MRIPFGLVAVLALVSIPSVTLAEPRTLEFGDRVHLQLAGSRASSIVGTIGSMSDSQLTLHTQGAKDIAETVPWTGVSRVDRSEGTRGHALFGALAGFLVAVTIGAATAPSGRTSVFEMDSEVKKAMLLMGGGLVVGAGLGASMRTERWRRISDPHLELVHR